MSHRSTVRRPSPAARTAPFAWVMAVLAAALLGPLAFPAAAGAHGYSTVVYVDATDTAEDGVRAVLELEYDLLVVSVSEYEAAPAFFEDGMAVFKTGEEAAALAAHADEIVSYVTERFAVSAGDAACRPERAGELTATEREGVPYAVLELDFDCDSAAAPVIRSELFPDSEQYVRDAVTILEYDVHGRTGSATLNSKEPVFNTEQPVLERFSHFFVLGAEHLLFGIDHILFLLALIVGSRRLRDVVLAATSFTIAHSVTFMLAALGLVSVPGAIVEPLIALSIAVVAVWYLWRVWRERSDPLAALPATRTRGLDATDRARFFVVFGFGLLHGLGFAGALGIDEPFSWPLLGSLLVFNVGIEAVQIAIIVALFPLLLLLRRRAPRTGLVLGIAVAAGVAAMGMVWFVERLLGVG